MLDQDYQHCKCWTLLITYLLFGSDMDHQSPKASGKEEAATHSHSQCLSVWHDAHAHFLAPVCDAPGLQLTPIWTHLCPYYSFRATDVVSSVRFTWAVITLVVSVITYVSVSINLLDSISVLQTVLYILKVSGSGWPILFGLFKVQALRKNTNSSGLYS